MQRRQTMSHIRWPEVPLALMINISVVWDVTPCRLVYGYIWKRIAAPLFGVSQWRRGKQPPPPLPEKLEFCTIWNVVIFKKVGRDSSVGTATPYGMVVQEIEARLGRDFLHPSTQALGPTQPTMQWWLIFFPEVKAAGTWNLKSTLTQCRGWRKSGAIPLIPLCVFMACSVVNFTSNGLYKPRITMLNFVADEPLNSSGFYRWSHPGEPNNLGGSASNPGEDCGSMHKNGGLNDWPCNADVPFICEQELHNKLWATTAQSV